MEKCHRPCDPLRQVRCLVENNVDGNDNILNGDECHNIMESLYASQASVPSTARVQKRSEQLSETRPQIKMTPHSGRRRRMKSILNNFIQINYSFIPGITNPLCGARRFRVDGPVLMACRAAYIRKTDSRSDFGAVLTCNKKADWLIFCRYTRNSRRILQLISRSLPKPFDALHYERNFDFDISPEIQWRSAFRD